MRALILVVAALVATASLVAQSPDVDAMQKELASVKAQLAEARKVAAAVPPSTPAEILARAQASYANIFAAMKAQTYAPCKGVGGTLVLQVTPAQTPGGTATASVSCHVK